MPSSPEPDSMQGPMAPSYDSVVTARVSPSSASPDQASMPGRQGLASPLGGDTRIRAVLFDLDGTLYRQGPMRTLMALELLTMPLYGPARAAARWRALRAYRGAQEHLRDRPAAGQAMAQLAQAATVAGLSYGETESLVHEWMQQRPLKYLRFCRASGLDELLGMLASAEVKAGVLSDYPADLKIGALGLTGRFNPVLCSTDPAIGVLKPHPRGFLRACAIWKLPPREVLMVGDRPEVDAAGAHAAGMPCVIIGRAAGRTQRAANYLTLPSFERLIRVLDDRR